jgi:hypothetical protein
LNGRIVAELVTGRQSELCDLWFVNRKPRLWPSKFFAVAAMRFVIGREMKSAKRRGIKAGLEALVTESQEGLSE